MNNYAEFVNGSEIKPARLPHGFFKALLGIIAFFLFGVFLLSSDTVAELTTRGAASVLYAVLPSTFPYLVLSNLILHSPLTVFIGKRLSFLSHKLRIHRSSLFVIIIGFISGFPVPSVILNRLYLEGACTKDECERICAFCSFCGPPFIISLFGKEIMKDIRAGFVVYGVQCFLSLLLAIVLAPKSPYKPSTSLPPKKSTDEPVGTIICNSISSAGASMLKITSFVIFFSVICGIIQKSLSLAFPNIPKILTTVVSAFFEMSSGIIGLKSSNAPEVLRFTLGCGYIYWSGLSVLFQVRSTLDHRISMKKYLLGRLFMLVFGIPTSYFIYFHLL